MAMWLILPIFVAMKEYKVDIEEEAQRVEEPVGMSCYAERPSALRHKRTTPQRHLTTEEYARKICFSDEEFENLKAHGFYQHTVPESQQFLTEGEMVADLDAADAEGYVSREEVEHLRSVWKSVG